MPVLKLNLRLSILICALNLSDHPAENWSSFCGSNSAADKKRAEWENAKHQTHGKDHLGVRNLKLIWSLSLDHAASVTWLLYFFVDFSQALRFYGSFNVTVTGITIQNSPQCHLKFDNCAGVLVHDMSVSSPGNSPNTDGIHLQNSKQVLIHTTNLACGNYNPYSIISSLGSAMYRTLINTLLIRSWYVKYISKTCRIMVLASRWFEKFHVQSYSACSLMHGCLHLSTIPYH